VTAPMPAGLFGDVHPRQLSTPQWPSCAGQTCRTAPAPMRTSLRHPRSQLFRESRPLPAMLAGHMRPVIRWRGCGGHKWIRQPAPRSASFPTLGFGPSAVLPVLHRSCAQHYPQGVSDFSQPQLKRRREAPYTVRPDTFRPRANGSRPASTWAGDLAAPRAVNSPREPAGKVKLTGIGRHFPASTGSP
jgi:hypothetical protein